MFDELAGGVRMLLTEHATFNVDRKAGLLQVTDFPERLDRIAIYLDAVQDRVHRQVQIDARLIEVEPNDAKAAGIDWAAVAGKMSGAPTADIPIATRQTMSGLRVTDVARLLSVLGEQGTVTVVANPRLLTLNNEPSIVRTDALTFSVTPQISGDSVLTLSLTPILKTPSIIEVGHAGAGRRRRDAGHLRLHARSRDQGKESARHQRRLVRPRHRRDAQARRAGDAADRENHRRRVGAVAMYETYYGFSEKPFSLTPDPKYLYRSQSHGNAFDLLQYAIRRREGFVVVTGDIGTGKTTLCRALLEQIDRTTFTALVLNPFLTEEDLLKRILQDFGVISRDEIKAGRMANVTKQELIETLYDFLLSLIPLKASAVLIIDEAQNLPLPVLEQIRILSNLETDKEKLLQIILVGQLNLQTLLRSPEMRQLDQRVSIRYELKPLDAETVAAYVAHRLTIAGGGAAVSFTPKALQRCTAGPAASRG